MFKHILYSVSICIAILLSGCKCPFCNCQQTSQKELKQISIANSEQFKKEVLESKIPTIAVFSAKWCGACTASKPIFDAISYELESKYKFITIDVDNSGTVPEENNIKGIPTFIFFKNGKVEHRMTQAISNKKDFIETIEKIFGK